MQQYQDLKIKCFLKFVIALNVLAYLAIIRCDEIRANCLAFCAAALVFSHL
jgi:hypothetical protein